MATFNIDKVGKNSLVLSSIDNGYNNFYTKQLDRLKHDENGSVTISYTGFNEVFL